MFELGAIGRRIEARYFQDGLVEVLAGMSFAFCGWMFLLGLGAGGGVFFSVCVLLWHLLRKRITYPRMGFVELEEERSGLLRALPVILLPLGVALLTMPALVIVGIGGLVGLDFVGLFSGSVMNLIFAAGALVVASFTSQKWFYLDAALLALSGLVVVGLGGEVFHAMICGGGLVAFVGCVRFARFIVRNPVIPCDDGDDY